MTAAAQDDRGASSASEFQRALDTYVQLPRMPIGASREELDRWRQELKAGLDRLIDEIDQLAQRPGASADLLLIKALSHAKRAGLLVDQRRDLDARYSELTADGATADKAAIDQLAQERADLAVRAAEEYQTLEAALRQSLETAESLRDQREMKLVSGVVLAQSAIVQDRAIDAAQDANRRVKIEPEALRSLLDESQQLLLEYLERTPRENGLQWVRGQFYLGVVEYRRSLKTRKPGEEYFTEVDPSRSEAFDRAREIFRSLSDPQEVLAILRPTGDAEAQRQTPAGRAYETSGFAVQSNYSYEAVAHYYAATSNLYLGLIAAIDQQYADSAGARLQAAEGFLTQAKTLDFYEPAPGQPPISLTANTVPVSYTRVMEGLRKATEEVGERRPLNDLTISFGLTPLYDSNVILLGRNTEAPDDKRRKRDFRVGTLFRMNYVADLDVLDPGNTELAKWQIFLEGRASSTWNARIHDFNEQFYGGTVNIRREILGPDEGSKLDGLYAHLRYDYDYVLLGNDGFLRVNRLRPMLQMLAFSEQEEQGGFVSSLVDASLFFSFEDRNYLELLRDERFDRDGNYFSWGADVRFDLGRWVDGKKLWGDDLVWGRWAPNPEDRDYRRPLELALGLEFFTNSTQGEEFDYASQVLSAGVVVPLPLGIDFSFRSFWEWQDYRGNSLIDRNRRGREDFIQDYAFRAERRFYLTKYPADFEFTEPFKLNRVVMTLFGDIRFTIDDSNIRDRLGQSVFEYNRVIYGAGVRFDIN